VEPGRTPVESFEELRRNIPEILEQINADPGLARAAAANPLFALEELGYELPEPLKRAVERRVRFKPDELERLDRLSSDVFQQAGHPFDIDSQDDLDQVLFEELQIPRPTSKTRRAPKTKRRTPQLPDQPAVPYRRLPQVGWEPRLPDPLEPIATAHPIMTPLLEYRALEASHPRLAPRELYDRARRGDTGITVTVRGRLKDGAE
jgi:hypothetical protein